MSDMTCQCLTCSDAAEPALVLELLGDGLARVELPDGPAEVSVELVAAEPGMTVLVHAGVAIGVLP